MTGDCACLVEMETTAAGACFSEGRTHRYSLWRRWGEGKLVAWLMLNPSTADETVLDPTLRRVEGFSKAWGFPGFVVVNAFALRATDPKALLAKPFGSVGAANDPHLWMIAEESAALIVGWGANLSRPALRFRLLDLRRILRMQGGPAPQCLGKSKDGSPKHPLYLAATTERVPFTW